MHFGEVTKHHQRVFTVEESQQVVCAFVLCLSYQVCSCFTAMQSNFLKNAVFVHFYRDIGLTFDLHASNFRKPLTIWLRSFPKTADVIWFYVSRDAYSHHNLVKSHALANWQMSFISEIHNLAGPGRQCFTWLLVLCRYVSCASLRFIFVEIFSCILLTFFFFKECLCYPSPHESPVDDMRQPPDFFPNYCSGVTMANSTTFFSCRGLLLPCTITAASIGQILTCTNGSLRVYLSTVRAIEVVLVLRVCACACWILCHCGKKLKSVTIAAYSKCSGHLPQREPKDCHDTSAELKYFFLVTSIQPLMHRQPCFAIKKGYMRCFKDNCSFFTHLLSMPCLF